MSKPRFLIKLKGAHERAGLTSYSVAKQLGLNQSTVRKYLTEMVEAEFLPNHVIQIVEFLGLDWRDPNVIEVIEGDEADTQPIESIDEDELKTPLAATA